MANYGYDPKVDYSKGINEAIANHDYRTASILEQQRNEKIRGEGLTQYQTTSHYADYLPKTDEINSGMDKLANPEQWSYDYQNDPAWQAYRKEYLREADRGTRDTLGTYSAQTGGMPSTAAVGAAQQAGNYYRSQLADKIPELMQQDYSRYMQGREADRADLSLLANMEAQRDAYSLDLQQFAWQKEQAQISAAMDRWATMGYADRSVAQILGVPEGTSTQSAQYQAWQQQQADLDRQRQERLDAADQEYRNWQMQNGDRDDAYSRAMTWIQMGIMPSDEALAAAGIDKAQAQRAVYLANAGGYSGGGRSSGGSSRRYYIKDKDKDKDKDEDEDETPKYTAEEIAEGYNAIRQAIFMSGRTGNISYAMDAFDRYADRLSDNQGAYLLAMLDRIQADIEQVRSKNSKTSGRSGRGTKDRDNRAN